MSRKWQRTKAWDDEHLSTPMLRPVKWAMRAFSSIWLAVVLLVIVALYGTLASVPIGMFALIPTWAVIIGTAAVASLGAGCLGVIAARAVIPAKKRGTRFAASVGAAIIGLSAGGLLWQQLVWPNLAYNPVTGEGLRFFSEFVDEHASTTLRRLPGFEMTELEFYSWWPLRVVLLLFVVNLTVATIRRIEFTFKNIGVLTVHSGIIIIALGSVYYQALKTEGDAILLAGQPPAGGTPGVGPPQFAYNDLNRVVLYVSQADRAGGGGLGEHRLLRGLPRYNTYGLNAGTPTGGGGLLLSRLMTGLPLSETEEASTNDGDRPLSLEVQPGTGAFVDPDIDFRVVGYVPYAEMQTDWRLNAELPAGVIEPRPVQILEVYSNLDDGSDGPTRFRFALHPTDPSHRIADNGLLAIEYAEGMDDRRWADLTAEIPSGVSHALVVEVPGAGPGGGPARVVAQAAPGRTISVGETGYTVTVTQLAPEPPFPIITAGYEGATSSVAVVRITTPSGEAYDRWVYHRFPEIAQDLTDQPTADGRPSRRDASDEIRVAYIDASRLQIYVDAPPGEQTRIAVRGPGGRIDVIEGEAFSVVDGPNGTLEILPEDIRTLGDRRGVGLVMATRYAHAERVERPEPVPEAQQDRQFIGTHTMAMIGVEVRVGEAGVPDAFRRVVWLPFNKYVSVGPPQTATVALPDGREVSLAFGRLRHRFAGFGVQLVDFEMIAYDHRGAPRDYQSIVRVTPLSADAGFDQFEHVVKLNAPLRAPHHWDEDRSWLSNMTLRLISGLRPDQYKLSQAGWDQAGWQRTQDLADQGLVPEPYAQFTILQVGNNPGIHLIAFGGILMGIGTPWAFYIKPWLVRRERDRLAKAAAARATPPVDATAEQAEQAHTAEPVGSRS